jgi:lysophospholipase L1-like esterase
MTDRLRATFLAVAFGCVLAVLVAATFELLCGLVLRRLGPVEPVPGVMPALEDNPAPLVADLDFLWRNEPGAAKTGPVNPRGIDDHTTWTARIDDDGFRGPDRTPPAGSERVYRVLCIGDSSTFGLNVDQGAEFPRRLERLLRRAYPGRAIEVVNAGVPGWSWMQGARFLRLRGIALHPDLVIAAFGTNDQFWPAVITDGEQFTRLEKPLVRGVEAVRQLAARTSAFRLALRLAPRVRRPSRSPGCERQIRETGGCHRVAVGEIEAAVADVHRTASAAGSELVVLNLDFWRSSAAQHSRAAAKAAGVPFLDMVERLDRKIVAVARARARAGGLVAPGPMDLDAAGAAAEPEVLLRLEASEPTARFTVQAWTWTPWAEVNALQETPLFDDGTHGDEVAHDGVYSVAMRRGRGQLRYLFHRDGVPEMAPLPPVPRGSAYRWLRVDRSLASPVHRLGELSYMSDIVHPDARGHAVIAATLARWLTGHSRSLRGLVAARSWPQKLRAQQARAAEDVEE